MKLLSGISCSAGHRQKMVYNPQLASVSFHAASPILFQLVSQQPICWKLLDKTENESIPICHHFSLSPSFHFSVICTSRSMPEWSENHFLCMAG